MHLGPSAARQTHLHRTGQLICQSNSVNRIVPPIGVVADADIGWTVTSGKDLRRYICAGLALGLTGPENQEGDGRSESSSSATREGRA